LPIDHFDEAGTVSLLPVLCHLSVSKADVLLGAVGIDGGNYINPE
jgi:hypothetical protein